MARMHLMITILAAAAPPFVACSSDSSDGEIVRGIPLAKDVHALSTSPDPDGGVPPTPPSPSDNASDSDLMDAPDSEYVPVPSGGRVHRSCVREVPSGHSVDGNPSGSPCRYRQHGRRTNNPGVPDVQSWIEWLSQYVVSPYWFSDLEVLIQVPAFAPQTNYGQTLFWWPGMTDGGGANLIQPVLQWGHSSAGGGPYYAIASWHVRLDGIFEKSPAVAVNPGDTLQLKMLSNCDNSGTQCAWQISATDTTTGVSSILNTNFNAVNGPMVMAYAGVLEVDNYNIPGVTCAEYPWKNPLYRPDSMSFTVFNMCWGTTAAGQTCQTPWGWYGTVESRIPAGIPNCTYSVQPTTTPYSMYAGYLGYY